MKEIRIHGRGGQGGVTLAKILATAQHLEGKSVQAFGIYAAERSGAPLQAFLRFDDAPIHNPNQIYAPDHIIVLDPTLISPAITSGLKTGGFILLNTPEPPDKWSESELFSAYRIATVDATEIAVRHGLGTRAVPIVNSALAGAAAHLFNVELNSVLEALATMGFHAGNQAAATDAYQALSKQEAYVEVKQTDRQAISRQRHEGFITGNTGAPPAIKTGQWANHQPLNVNRTPPCNFICPAGNDVQGFLDALARENVDEALSVLLRSSPLPSICGRVCPGFCMMQCNRLELDEAVNVRALERYAGDHGRALVEAAPARPEKVAVVGSGPAGLSAAWHLAMLGYQTTIFEADDELGGLMRTGIPPYRLPRDVLDREIDRILDLGVKTEMNTTVDRDMLHELADTYDGVVAATGLQRVTSIDLGLDMRRVLQGLEFLDRARDDTVSVTGEDVVVIGGGNTAVDAARSAYRMGANSVRIVYRRTVDEMPAIPEEVEDAIDEGIKIDFLVSPLRISRTNGRRELLCERMELGKADDSGRRRPVAIPGSEFGMVFDRVILALGQKADLSLLDPDVDLSPRSTLNEENDTPVYAAGDLLTNEGTVTAAIGCGRDMALHLHENFSGEHLYTDKPAEDSVVRADRIRLHHFPVVHSSRQNVIPMDRRKETFDEVRGGLDSMAEAKRCLSCGVCNQCDRCVTYCPDGVLKREGNDLVFNYEYCKGCGVCASECSRAVIYMKAG